MKKSDARSVIQPEFDDLRFSGEYALHHVFPGKNRKRCEIYGFMVMIRPAMHDEIHKNPNGYLDLQFKQECQTWYENNVGTRQDFINEFGKNYL